MSGVVTLAERHLRKMEQMERAIVEIDARLTAYAREQGGRFIRYGSTAKGRMRQHSDDDIIADFGDPDVTQDAANCAETICAEVQMKPDVRYYVSPAFLKTVIDYGIVLE